MAYEELLKSKGFQLNTYSEGKFWELTVENDEKLKAKICRIFGAEIGLNINTTNIEVVILQCAEDFSKCVFYYDCDPFHIETKEFMNCIQKTSEE